MQVEDCVFCRIGRSEAKAWTVYEDDLLKAFLDINPISEGHTLIIPKEHHENIYDITDSTLQRIVVVAKKLAKKYQQRLGVKAVNILHASGKEAQQSVFHFHLHLVPRRAKDGINLWYKAQPMTKTNFENIISKIGSIAALD
jgi:histidine triad (HIT) family protein